MSATAGGVDAEDEWGGFTVGKKKKGKKGKVSFHLFFATAAFKQQQSHSNAYA
jgi:hypothetical protein